MAEHVAVSGFNVPPAAPGADERGAPAPVQPPAGNMAPGFVPPNQGGTFTQAQVDAQIAAAIAAATKAPAAPAPAAPAPVLPVSQGAGFNLSEEVGSDPVLASFTQAFSAIGNGIDINRAIGNALTHGNAALIDTAYLAEKGGAQAAQLQTIAQAIVDRVQTQTAAATDAVYSTAGGKEQWTTAAAVFDQNAPKHLKVVIANLLESGNAESIRAGAQTVIDFVKQNGLVSNPAVLLNAGAGNLGSGQALSKAEFQDLHAKLDPNGRNYAAERESLFARRSLGKQLGK